MVSAWKKVISAMVAGILVLYNIPLSGAAYEEYLPTITRLEATTDGWLIAYYTVPFEGDQFQYRIGPPSYNIGYDVHFDKNERGKEEQECAFMWKKVTEKGVYPIFVSLYSRPEKDNQTWAEQIAREQTDFSVDIDIIPALDTQDVIFKKTGNIQVGNDGVVKEQWQVNLGTGYPVGIYSMYDITNENSNLDVDTNAISGMGYVQQNGNPLILWDWVSADVGLEIDHEISKENMVFRRYTCTGISSDGKTAYVEATQKQHTNTESLELPEVSQSSDTYIYDETDPAENMDFVGTLDNVIDETSAMDAVDKALTEVTDEQKQSVTGIDKLTLLAEEAAAKANTVSVDSGVINVTSADIPATANSALTATTGVLSDAGINMQRNPRAIVNYDVGNSETVSVKTESLPETVDKVRVTTDYAMATVDAQQASSFTMSDRGNQTIEVNFDTDYETVVTVSFPGMSANDTYKAVVDAEGKPVGGKYNPATGTLEAKLTESGVYRVVNNEADFTDIKDKSQEMQDAIKELASKGIINGTTETTYAPDDTISRAEVTALLMRTLSLLNPNANGGFADVTSANWYCGAAGSAKEHNIINGFEDNTFRGDAVIAKDQIVAVSSRTLREQMDYKTPSDINGELSVYSDAGSIENWAREDVALATMTNLVLKRTDGKFGGSAGMTRGDAAIIIKRLFDKMW